MAKIGAAPAGVYTDNGVTLQALLGPDGSQYPMTTGIVSLSTDLSRAAGNSAAIQAAVNNTGLVQLLSAGVYYVSGTVAIPSYTFVYLGAGVELRQLPGATFQSFFTNVNNTPTLHAVSSVSFAAVGNLATTQMARATVQYATDVPTVNVGDTVIIDGDIAFAVNGDHLVETVNVAAKQITYLFGCTSLPANSNSVPTFSISGSFSGLTLTVTAAGGVITPGQQLGGAGIQPGTQIQYQTSGTPGGAGVYQITTSGNTATTFTGLASQIVISKADTTLGVIGNGKLNGNFIEGGLTGNGGFSGNLQDHAIWFNNVVRPMVGGGDTGFLTINDGSQYCVCMARAVDPKVIGLHSDGTRKDGAHFYGPIFGLPEIRRVTGDYGDDCAIFQPVDGASYINLIPYGILNGSNVYGGNFYEGGLMQDIKVTYNGNSGQAALYPCMSMGGSYIGSTTYQMYGRYDIINIGHKYPTYNGQSGFAVAVGNGYCPDLGFIDEIYIDGAIGAVTINNGGAAKSIYIGRVSIKNWSNFDMLDYESGSFDYINIGRLDIEADYYGYGGAMEYLLALGSVNCVINQLVISGKFNSYTNYELALINSVGATVNVIKYNDIELINNAVLIKDGSTFSNTPSVLIDDIDFIKASQYPFSMGAYSPMNIKVSRLNGNGPLFNFYGTGHAGS